MTRRAFGTGPLDLDVVAVCGKADGLCFSPQQFRDIRVIQFFDAITGRAYQELSCMSVLRRCTSDEGVQCGDAVDEPRR
jgi:hypothetical protein